MRIGVFGLGYVGAVSAACLAGDGHDVAGVDPNRTKVDLINQGSSPVIERDLGDLIAAGVRSGNLRATADPRDGIVGRDLALVSVATPSRPNGSIDVSYVERVAEEIGTVLRDQNGFFVVALRSTVLPGTTRETVIPALERSSGKRVGADFGVAFNPEFLREGTSVADYYDPPKIVIGATDEESRERVASLFAHLDAPLIETDLETAELVKYVDNAWHALKVGFANEVGRVGKALGIDAQRVMDIFCSDTKLNLSDKYLRPGFAFGGSCLPKDLRALRHRAHRLDVDVPILDAILPSNARHIDRAFEMIVVTGHRRVGLLGLAFKAGTDDLRESPMVEIVERLIGKGYDVRVHDPEVSMTALVGPTASTCSARFRTSRACSFPRWANCSSTPKQSSSVHPTSRSGGWRSC